MSIAVSATVYPSKILFRLTACMCVGLILVALLIGFGIVGNIDLFATSSLVLLCFFFASFAFFRTLAWRKACYFLQVSGRGQVRLSVAVNRDKMREMAVNERAVSANVVRGNAINSWLTCEEGALMRLLPISTLWASVMILHFRDEDGRTISMVILQDSFADQQDKKSYRALLVACRWALRHQATNCVREEKFL